MQQIVSNTGPLISLEKLNQGYNFIRCLYEKLIIPPAVLDEVAEGQFVDPQEYLHYYNITDLIERSSRITNSRYFRSRKVARWRDTSDTTCA